MSGVGSLCVEDYVHLPDYLSPDEEDVGAIELKFSEDEILVDCRELENTDKFSAIEVRGVEDETVGLEDLPPVEEVDMNDVVPNRFDVLSPDRPEHLSSAPDAGARLVKEWGFFPNFPVARKVEDGYELLDGHVRAKGGKDAGLDRMPIYVLELSDKEAMFYWAQGHFPHPDDEQGQEVAFYSEEEQRDALERMLEDWDRDVLRESDCLRHALENLGM